MPQNSSFQTFVEALCKYTACEAASFFSSLCMARRTFCRCSLYGTVRNFHEHRDVLYRIAVRDTVQLTAAVEGDESSEVLDVRNSQACVVAMLRETTE